MGLLPLTDLLALAGLALAGAGHCAGMCGGFALGASAPTVRGQVWTRLALYQAGKTLSYVFLGLVLLAGLETMYSRSWIVAVQRGLGLTLGVAMIVLGLGYAFGWRLVAPWERGLSRLGGCAAGIGWGRPSAWRALGIGWLNGLLPCGLSLAAMVYVLRFRAVGEVVTGLIWFGLCTIPVMAVLVWLGSRVSLERRQRWLRWGGWAMVVGGIITLSRSIPGVHAWVQSLVGDGWWSLPVDAWCE